MKLIYAWIEKYRNIEQCGIGLSNDFIVDIKNANSKREDISIKRVSIKKGKKNLSIYGDNISEVTVIVGKNGVGKSNFITCIGDLFTSLDESSFMLIYYDEEKDDFILECNHIGIKDDLGVIKYAIHRDMLWIKFKNGNIEKIIHDDHKMIYNTEYIMIKDKLNDRMYPRANAISPIIPRFGLQYKKTGVLYQFKYLNNIIDNIENYKNNDIKIRFQIVGMLERIAKEYELSILPCNSLNEVSYYDYKYNHERSEYKKVYMLRFWEVTLNKLRFPKDKLIQNDMQEIRDMLNRCNGDIKELLNNYDIIKEKTIKIKNVLMKNGKENRIDIEKCYRIFVNLLEQIIEKIDDKCFWNSYEFSIKISSILQDKQLSQNIYDLLELADSKDIDLEFIGNKIKIEYENLSDGLRERFNVFSTIYKCFKQNKVEDFKNVILILDEPDTHMHPEWSRRLFTEILDFLNKEFSDSKFQIIFTTHSPFMLSDILKKDVIYLDKSDTGKLVVKDNNINTFGANIHTLLKHSFFIDSTMGEFARSNINEVLKFLNSQDYVGRMDKEKAKFICENIGEELVKNKMINLYKKRFPEEIEDKDEKINYLEKRVLHLERL